MENNSKTHISFAAIDPYIESNIVLPTEAKRMGTDRIMWGVNDAYPDYLLKLEQNTPTLASIISGTVDFIVGDDVQILPLSGAYAPGQMNTHRQQIREQVRDLAHDYETYGGFALQVIRSLAGNVVEIYYLDMRFVRSNKDNTVFYYSEKWGKSGRKVLEYPAFRHFTPEEWTALQPEDRARHVSSIVYVKDIHTQTYPRPLYAAAVKACETERCIDDYHLNEINNGFMPPVVINFNNGYPGDEMAKEIETEATEKFVGHQNAGRPVFSWNESKETQTTVVPIKTDDYGSRYESLAKHCRQQIFTAFRANPNLFGIPTESLGFSQEEYESAFRLYNRTCVKPAQRIICDAYDRIYGQTGVLTIKPFSIEETAAEQNVN